MALAVATSASTDAVASTTIAATQPASIADGDILVAFVAKNTTTAPSTVPSGWALIVTSDFRASFPAGTSLGANCGTGWMGVYWKVAASESGTYTWGSTSATWNVQILRLTGFRGVKPAGSVNDQYLCPIAKNNTRSSTTISANKINWCNLEADGYLCIHQFVQTVVGSTCTFSALSGTMTSIANSNQTGVSQQVAWEYLDLTSNPNFGSRQVTTDQTTGSTAGYMCMFADPSSTTGIPTDKRNDLRQQAS